MIVSPLLKSLVEALRCLPGVGPKSAQRMAYHLLEHNRAGGKLLAETMALAMTDISHCQKCRNFTEQDVCVICQDLRREESTLCVVESPADVLAIEQTAGYRGQYFVLMGHLSPLDGIGPEDLQLHKLEQRLTEGNFSEVILATGSTVEGEATAHYIFEMCKKFEVQVSRLAQGVPLGGDLEYVDGGTLAHSLAGRRPFA